MKLIALILGFLSWLALSQPLATSQALTRRFDNDTELSQWDPDDGMPRARLYNRAGFLSTHIHIGSPPQTVEVLVDTGSDVTWVNSPDNEYCIKKTVNPSYSHKKTPVKTKHSLLCERYGFFHTEKSDTCHANEDSSFKDGTLIGYLDSTNVKGKYYKDKLVVGSSNLTVDAFPFGVATQANSAMGVLGLAPPTYERDKDGQIKYTARNLVQELRASGQISRAIFSMWLGEEWRDHGQIDFGSVDKAKFSGDLLTLKLVQEKSKASGPMTRYEVLISGMYLDKSSSTSDIFELSDSFGEEVTSAIVDSGSKFTSLPEDLYNTLMKQIEGAFEIDSGKRVIQMDSGSDESMVTNDTIRFKFGKSTVKVPLKGFLTKYVFMSNEELHDSYGNKLDASKDYYTIGFAKSKGPYSSNLILGHNFMRQLYTVFDLDRMELSIAPAINTPKSHLQKLGRGDGVGGVMDGIPEEALDKYSLPKLYDLNRDFVMDTNGGYYIDEKTSGASSNSKVSLTSIAVTIFVALWIGLR